jgi:hypothetical protein
MKIYKSQCSLGLPFAPTHSPTPHSHIFNWACLIGLVLLGGCGMIDGNNTSDRPWDRPGKADVYKGWWFEQEYWNTPGGHFP